MIAAPPKPAKRVAERGPVGRDQLGRSAAIRDENQLAGRLQGLITDP
jgi:hypothetical protein